jgi:D-alanyl-D-alanine carboxypeptidase (penicillin-binding protein 5/6)
MPLPALRLISTVLVLVLVAALPARAYETRAEAAWIYDMASDTVLFEKNADVPLPPASMSKLMTLNMLFEALRDGRVTRETAFSVSPRAKAMGGSTMFLDERDRPSVDDLIRGIIVNSGNDACVVVAEGLAGSEEVFSRLMTERAKALGMTQTNLVNSSGWPAPEHRMSMRDLGVLAKRLITEFPEDYKLFAETEFNYANRSEANKSNRNPLLKMSIGADGLKTGHTSEAGYGLVGSVVQGDRRVIFVITGLASEAARAQESQQIVNWAYRQFVLKTVAAKGEPLASAPVWLGDARFVDLVPAEDVRLLLPTIAQGGVQAEAVYSSPLEAPIAAGQVVGELVITVPGLPESKRVALVAAHDVARGNILVRLRAAAARLVFVAKNAVSG